MKRLTLDITPLFETQWTGIPVFTRRLIQALLRHGGIDLRFMFRLTEIPHGAVMAAIAAGTGAFLRDGFESEAGLHAPLADRAGPFLYPSVKDSFAVAEREASTVHDMSTLLMPELHEEANVAYHLDHFARSLATDEVVFCISEATRAALVAAFPSVAGRARVIYQYVDWPDRFDAMDRDLPALQLGRYAVVVGTIEPRKNLGLLLRALETPELRRSPLRFVVIGRKGWNVDGFLQSLPPDARERILFSGFVSEFTKYRLIKGADFMVFPSLYEGFGIPALEAMSLGKPVLASRSSSLPEVVGEAGVYFDPCSIEEFGVALEEIFHAQRLGDLGGIARDRSRAFGWDSMAKPVVEWVRHQDPGPSAASPNLAGK